MQPVTPERFCTESTARTNKKLLQGSKQLTLPTETSIKSLSKSQAHLRNKYPLVTSLTTESLIAV